MDDWENEREPKNFEKIKKSGFGKTLEALMKKNYTPSTRVDMSFKGKELTILTNENGDPITLFIGKRRPNGDIAGDMYSRRIKKIENGQIKESHWDNQGKV